MMKKMIFALLIGLGLSQVSTAVAATAVPKAEVKVKASGRDRSLMTKVYIGAALAVGFGFFTTIVSSYDTTVDGLSGKSDGDLAKAIADLGLLGKFTNKLFNIQSGVGKIVHPSGSLFGMNKSWGSLGVDLAFWVVYAVLFITLADWAFEVFDEPVIAKWRKFGEHLWSGEQRKQIKKAVDIVEAEAAK